jgi:hypothetical protein
MFGDLGVNDMFGNFGEGMSCLVILGKEWHVWLSLGRKFMFGHLGEEMTCFVILGKE